MAVVWLARRPELDRDVALKELASFHAVEAGFAERFAREARVGGALAHPNIVTVFEAFEHGDVPYIAMEYAERCSLRAVVGRLSLAQVAGVLEGCSPASTTPRSVIVGKPGDYPNFVDYDHVRATLAGRAYDVRLADESSKFTAYPTVPAKPPMRMSARRTARRISVDGTTYERPDKGHARPRRVHRHVPRLRGLPAADRHRAGPGGLRLET
jgi:hypothetical protein